MGRSASVLAAAVAATVLAGCATTQQEAARLQLNAARERATQLAVHVGQPSPTVTVARVGLLRTADETAIVVRLVNRGSRPVSDLPISVGVRAPRGRPVLLNGGAGTGYFKAHVPAISAGGTLVWVLTTARAVPAGAFPRVLVGHRASVPLPRLRALPGIAVAPAGAQPRRGELDVTVSNRSPVPQYGMPVYAIARSGSRIVAAGAASITHLGGGSKAKLRIRLIGRAAHARVTVQAPPTIFG